jgi:hypothetical protein
MRFLPVCNALGTHRCFCKRDDDACLIKVKARRPGVIIIIFGAVCVCVSRAACCRGHAAGVQSASDEEHSRGELLFAAAAAEAAVPHIRSSRTALFSHLSFPIFSRPNLSSPHILFLKLSNGPNPT